VNNQSFPPVLEKEHRKRNALIISSVISMVFTLFVIIAGLTAYREIGGIWLWGFTFSVIAFLAGIFSIISVSINRITLGISVLIGTILILSLSIPLIAQGQGLALSILVLITVATISSATLSLQWSFRAILISVIFAVIITLVDLFLPDLGLPVFPKYSTVIAIFVSVIYVYFILRRFNFYAFRTKIIIALLLVTIVPLIALGYFNNQASTRSLESQSRTQLSSLTGEVANSINGFFTDQLITILADSKQLSLVQFVELPPTARSGSPEETNARATLFSLLRKNSVFIQSVGVLDPSGINILDSSDTNQGQDESNFPYFKQPFHNRLPFVSNVFFKDGQASIYFSAPIYNGRSGVIAGILRVKYNAAIIQSIVRKIDTGSPETTISVIDGSTYLQLANTGSRDELFTSVKKYSALDLAALQAENRIPNAPGEKILSGIDSNLVAGIDHLQAQPFFNGYSKYFGSDTINNGRLLETQPWVVLVHQSTKIYLAPVNDQNKSTILISLVLIIFSLVSGYFASQILTSPLLRLSRVAENITAGDRSARASVLTNDEIGALSTSFNRMTDELNEALNSLETRVAERTTDLEVARQESEYRARELQSIGEISKIITGEQNLDILLPLISRLVTEKFGFYHTGIFLVDEIRLFAVLQAANSEGGKKMLDRGHKLEIGGSSIVGYVAKFGTPRIALDVGLDATFFNNPDLPSTRSEMALPLLVRGDIVGVLDVQSEKPGAFTENDTNTLSILADQIAIALENARLFSQTQQALNEAQALYRQNLQEGWLTFSHQEASVGYQQSTRGGKKLNQPVESDEIREAMNRGDVMVFDKDGFAKEPSIVVPIKLRGQIIGALNIKAPARDRRWTNDEIDLAEAISERLSIALENARLIQESQRQVIKEQTITEVTGKIGASINLKNVMQTAVEELGRALPGSEVLIKLNRDDKQGTS
jgi:GAF domain-containing protein/HAMP domain-containing protein